MLSHWAQKALRWALSAPMFVKIFGIGALAASVFGLLTLLVTRSSVDRSFSVVLEHRAHAASVSLAAHLETLLAAEGVDRAAQSLDRLIAAHPDLEYAVVRDAQGKVVASRSGRLTAESLFHALADSGSSASVIWLPGLPDPIYRATTPLTGVLSGTVEVGLNGRQSVEQIRVLDRTVAIGLVLSVLAAAALAGVLAHLVSIPIHQLVDAANRVGEGDFDVRARPICDDEIGQLAEAFNRMTQRLAEYRRQVNEKERDRCRLLQQLVDTQEEERKHIARELHDQLGQSLMALLLWVQSECRFDGGGDQLRRTLEGKIRDLADEIHRLAWGMRPSILDDYGLERALARYLEELSKQAGIAIDYQSTASPDAQRLPDRLEVALYRIVQEAMTNVIRHSGAAQASVVLLRQADEVTLLVEDDGCGFDPAAVLRESRRLGITGIRERAALFGGVSTVESERGHGTTLRVRIPLGEQVCLSVS